MQFQRENCFCTHLFSVYRVKTENMRTNKPWYKEKEVCRGKGHNSRSACWVLGKVCYEVDRGIVVPLMKWHRWLCIPLDIYTQVRTLSQLTHTLYTTMTPSINQHSFRFASYSTLIVLCSPSNSLMPCSIIILLWRRSWVLHHSLVTATPTFDRDTDFP